ncbi:fluoride efflux transporter FluC [Natronospira bacteriovora]|uniref:Fluoride-specific ion channel FluC n=1 Tax=Natronospira bacteriovora TaxID=3069753 RepID=A0ABU0W2Y7_9GAMM|nr:CrcB family protein [Natronospira sp. AB-CW4]MDQ2068377.1 CrcB family protein [Natronospira sp. AB-CW4]
MSPERPRPDLAIAVAIGGAIGSGLRHGVDVLLSPWLGALPDPGFEATFLVNAVGCFLIGVLAVLTGRRGPLGNGPRFRAFIITGLLGGFTTASLFSLEVLALIQADELGMAGLYVLASFSICLAAVWLAYALTWPVLHGRALRRRSAMRRAGRP